MSTGHKRGRARLPESLATPAREAASSKYKTMLGKINSGPLKLQEEIPVKIKAAPKALSFPKKSGPGSPSQEIET